MRQLLRGAALLLLVVFVMPVFAADDAKDAKKTDPKDVKKDDVKDPKDVKKDDVKDPKKDEPKKDDPKKDDPKKDDPKKDDPKKDDPKKDPKKDDPKKDDPKKDDPKMPAKEVKKDNGMVKVGQVTGTIVNVNEGAKSLKISIGIPKLNPQAAQALAQAQLALQQASIPRQGQKPQDLINAIANAQKGVADQQRNLYTITQQEVELTCLDDVVVRVMELPPMFDDKGKVKALTAKEKAEAKGDPKLPGYKGEMADLRSNQNVQVTLCRHKSAKPVKINPKTKDVDPEVLAELKPQISMVVVVGEKRQP